MLLLKSTNRICISNCSNNSEQIANVAFKVHKNYEQLADVAFKVHKSNMYI